MLDEILVPSKHVDVVDDKLVRVLGMHNEAKRAQQLALVADDCILGRGVVLRCVQGVAAGLSDAGKYDDTAIVVSD